MKVVFLHGIGDGDPQRKWFESLNNALKQLGHPSLTQSDVVAPRYAAFLKMDGVSAKIPPSTYKPKDDTVARQDFERRQARVQRILQLNPSVQRFGFDVVPEAVFNNVPRALPITKIADAFNLAQVRRYIGNDGLRGAIMTRILEELPVSGDIILIGHSLGSVIAIDLLDHLPETLHVRRFITIGSPANMKALHDRSERLLKKFPYCRVDDWSNFLNRLDPVTGGRGLAGVFPGAQDFVLGEVSGHGAEKYLSDSAVAGLVADVFYPRKEVALASSDLEVRLTDGEAWILLTQHFGDTVAHRIKDEDVRRRYRSALKLIREDLASQLTQVSSSGHAIAPEMRQLASGGELPVLPRRWEVHDAVALLVVLAVVNCVAPYEIEVGDARKLALADIAADLGFREDIGKKVRQALDDVEKAVSGEGFPWGRVLATAAGVALLAAGPVGLLAAAPASAFGAAAITGGLAAFGPGGMAGGLAMLGGLAGAGAAVTTAAAIAGGGAGVSLPILMQMTLRVTTEHARNLLGLPYDAALWYQLADFESYVCASINRLETFSDKKSPKLQQLEDTRSAINALLRFMLLKGLAPVEITDGEPRK